MENNKNINSEIVKNCLEYNDLSFEFDVMINKKPILFNSGSSAIISDEEGYIMNVRCINYYLDEQGGAHKSGDKTITYNTILYLDNKFNVTNEKYMVTNLKPNAPYLGIEDIRLFRFHDDIYFTGSMYNEQRGKIDIVSNILDLSSNIFEPKFIRPSFLTTFNWEKNWVFFSNNDELCVIYKWFPLYICKIDYTKQSLNLLQSNSNVPKFFKRLKGSTCGIEYDDKIWFISHFHKIITGKRNQYLHVFVVFDKKMNLLGYTEPFKFENKVVEYCIGLALNEDNNFVITYSILDKTTKLIVLEKDYVNSLIIPYSV